MSRRRSRPATQNGENGRARPARPCPTARWSPSPTSAPGSTRLIARSSILYVQSHGDFVRIVTEDGRYLLRATLERDRASLGAVRVRPRAPPVRRQPPTRRRAPSAARRHCGARVRRGPDDPDRPAAHGGAGTAPGRLRRPSLQLWSSCPRPRTRARQCSLTRTPTRTSRSLPALSWTAGRPRPEPSSRLARGRGSDRRPPDLRACSHRRRRRSSRSRRSRGA